MSNKLRRGTRRPVERTASQGGIEIEAVGEAVQVTLAGIACPECGEGVSTSFHLTPAAAEALAASITRAAAKARQGGDA